MMSACPACPAAPLAEDLTQGPALQFSLPTVHCAACIGKIERGLSALPGVGTARLNLSQKRLRVTGQISAGDVIAAVSNLGYDAYPLDPDALTAPQDDRGRSLMTRMAVAGFAMMNVMLLSVAVWSGATDATRDMFHLISAAIALPVVAYAGIPFFQSALSALRAGSLNMDVPISLAIILASGMSLFETLQGGDLAYFDAALSLTFFLLIGRFLDHQTRSKARSAAGELTALEVHTAMRVRDGHAETVNASQLQADDEIIVPTGARVPVDGLLLTGSALVDRSIITGESDAMTLSRGASLSTGEINLAAPFHMRATSVGEETSLRRMAALVETAENARNSYTALADKAARIYAPAVHGIALFGFVGWYATTGDLRHSINVAIALLIITCPCALGLAVPAVSTAAVSRLFSLGYLVKNGTALERLAEVTRVIFDKTGTLTRPAVQLPADLPTRDRQIAKALAQSSNHPLSKALVECLTDTHAATVEDITEVSGHGIEGSFGGKPVRLGRGTWLGAGFHGLGLKIGDAPAWQIEVPETLRDGVEEALPKLNLPCEVITGDGPGPSHALARRLAIPVTSGARPVDKLALLERCADAGDRVLMVGDGLNDTAALAKAHASIAPATALEASRTAADIVILKESFSDLPTALEIARATRRLSQQNFAIAAIYNAIAIPIAMAGLATPLMAALAMSLSSITVLLNSQRMRWVK